MICPHKSTKHHVWDRIFFSNCRYKSTKYHLWLVSTCTCRPLNLIIANIIYTPTYRVKYIARVKMMLGWTIIVHLHAFLSLLNILYDHLYVGVCCNGKYIRQEQSGLPMGNPISQPYCLKYPLRVDVWNENDDWARFLQWLKFENCV